MRYGFVVPNNFGVQDPIAVAALGVQAEELGFDSVWVNHHILNVGYVKERLGNNPYHDALVMMTWITSQTSRINIGSSVLVLPYLHPMVLAKEIATLDHLSKGRIQLGVGVGSLPDENEALGVPYDTRGAYMNEFLDVLIALWTKDEASYEGTFFNFKNIVTSPKPYQKPYVPLYVGGNRPPALRRVAAYGNGWHPMMVSPEGLQRRWQTIEETSKKLQKSPPAEIQLRQDMARMTPELINQYESVGVTEMVLGLNTGDIAKTESEMTRFAKEVLAA